MSDPLLAGRYALGGLVGAGGSADVHAAVDVRLGRDVAVKVVRTPAPPGTDPHTQLRAAARLDHPNVVRVLDAGVDGAGRAFVVLELVVGRTLAEILRDGPMGVADALVVMDGVLAGLAHAHERGVLHLDLSPANVMVSRLGGARGGLLLDLGSTPPPDPRRPRVTVSPHYASPEVAQATGADVRSDVYSAGALLFHLVTGRPPFDREDPDAVLAAQVHDTPPRAGSLLTGLAPEVDRIVARALAKDPGRRYAGAAAMRDDVVAAGRRLAVRPAPSPAGSRPTSPRTTRELAVVPIPARTRGRWGGVVVVGLAGAFVTWLALAPWSAADAPPAATTAGISTATASVTPPPAVVSTPTAATPSSPAPAPVVVPDLVGLLVDDARSMLEAMGLALGEVVPADAPVAGGSVLSSAPVAGQVQVAGGPVAVVVASGLVPVPDVVGRPAQEAYQALVRAGLVGVEREVSGSPPGVVAGTEPAAGEPAEVGGTVVLLVGAREAMPTPSATPPVSPTPAPAPSTIP